MVLVGLAVAWCGWASAFPAGTRDGQAMWAASLAGVVAVDVALSLVPSGAWTGRLRRAGAGSASDRARAARGEVPLSWSSGWPWAVLLVVVVVWEILGIDTGPHQPHLTLSALTLAFRGMRAATLAVWIGLGVVFAVVRRHARQAGGGDGRWSPRHRPPRSAPGAGATAAMVAFPATARSALVPTRALPRPEPMLALLLGDSRAVGVGFWIGVVACAVLVELAARRAAATVASFETVMLAVTGPPVARLAAVAAWVYAGWHLFAH